MASMTKNLWVVNIDNFAPEITKLTYPLLRYYAKKIGATFRIISERRYPKWPPVYEKLQIHSLAVRYPADWNIYYDSDALVHPETIDWTLYLNKDTVAHNGIDQASIRWRYDKYFMRDGRNVGSCNWCTIGSDWCLDLWKPLDDLSFDEALDNIYPTVEELNTVITPEHLIDDYVLSRNIARYGLKVTTLNELQKKVGLDKANFHWHAYTMSIPEKVEAIKKVVSDWKVERIVG